MKIISLVLTVVLTLTAFAEPIEPPLQGHVRGLGNFACQGYIAAINEYTRLAQKIAGTKSNWDHISLHRELREALARIESFEQWALGYLTGVEAEHPTGYIVKTDNEIFLKSVRIECTRNPHAAYVSAVKTIVDRRRIAPVRSP